MREKACEKLTQCEPWRRSGTCHGAHVDDIVNNLPVNARTNNIRLLSIVDNKRVGDTNTHTHTQ